MLRTTLRKGIPARRLLSLPCYVRTYATPAASTHALVFIEHQDGALDSGSLSAVTAARQLGGKVTGLIVGAEGVDGVVEKAKK
jgi:electron transfer flavoprotein alpha subunit